MNPIVICRACFIWRRKALHLWLSAITQAKETTQGSVIAVQVISVAACTTRRLPAWTRLMSPRLMLYLTNNSWAFCAAAYASFALGLSASLNSFSSLSMIFSLSFIIQFSFPVLDLPGGCPVSSKSDLFRALWFHLQSSGPYIPIYPHTSPRTGIGR